MAKRTPEQAAKLRRLIAGLRELQAGADNGYNLVHITGDGEFIWDYHMIMEMTNPDADHPYEPIQCFGEGPDGEGCGTKGCALGLGHVLGLFQVSSLMPRARNTYQSFDNEGNWRDAGRQLGMKKEDICSIFYNDPIGTPGSVADKLEALL